jgi:glycosyltransferase involved in cell wall biosynthesis
MQEKMGRAEATRITDDSLAIVIPARNEEASIASVLAELRSEVCGSIIVVDDHSSDGTASVAFQTGADYVLSLPSSLGAWGATQTGLRFGLDLGKAILVTIDADGQHPAREIQKLIAPIQRGEADICIGAYTARAKFSHRLVWAITRGLAGLHYTDMTSGFKCYSKAAATAAIVDVMATFEFQDVGVLASLKRAGLTGVEVPVTMRERQHGESKIFNSWRTVIYYVASACLVALTKRKWW